MTGLLFRPLARVGVYVPGGKALYPSSVLMNVLPAKVAGVPEVIMVSPPGPDGRLDDKILAAASVCGVDQIFSRWAALRPSVRLRTGQRAFREWTRSSGRAISSWPRRRSWSMERSDVDSIAGPSEILVLADETANPVYVAADLLSQAEHDELAGAILITTSQELADQVAEEMERQTAGSPAQRDHRGGAFESGYDYCHRESGRRDPAGQCLRAGTHGDLYEGAHEHRYRGFRTQAPSTSDPIVRNPWATIWRAPIMYCPRVGRHGSFLP